MGKGRGLVTGPGFHSAEGLSKLSMVYSPKSLQLGMKEGGRMRMHEANTHQHGWQLSKAEQHKRSWKKETGGSLLDVYRQYHPIERVTKEDTCR